MRFSEILIFAALIVIIAIGVSNKRQFDKECPAPRQVQDGYWVCWRYPFEKDCIKAKSYVSKGGCIEAGEKTICGNVKVEPRFTTVCSNEEQP